jgi:hypothetical protein
VRVQGGAKNIYHVGFRGTLTVDQGMSYGILGVTDTFTDTNGTNLTAHVPDSCPAGAAYAVASRSYEYGVDDPAGDIQSNTLRIQDSGDGGIRGFAIESGLGNCTINLHMTGNAINPTAPAVFFRDDGTDCFIAWLAGYLGTCYIFDVDGTTLDSDSLTFGVNDVAHITVVLSGTSITATFENETDVASVVLTATSSNNQTATKHGPGARTVFGAGASDYFDNFTVAK